MVKIGFSKQGKRGLLKVQTSLKLGRFKHSRNAGVKIICRSCPANSVVAPGEIEQ
jgi:hypothetical protein